MKPFLFFPLTSHGSLSVGSYNQHIQFRNEFVFRGNGCYIFHILKILDINSTNCTIVIVYNLNKLIKKEIQTTIRKDYFSPRNIRKPLVIFRCKKILVKVLQLWSVRNIFQLLSTVDVMSYCVPYIISFISSTTHSSLNIFSLLSKLEYGCQGHDKPKSDQIWSYLDALLHPCHISHIAADNSLLLGWFQQKKTNNSDENKKNGGYPIKCYFSASSHIISNILLVFLVPATRNVEGPVGVWNKQVWIA